jgi:hypothetical protein
MNDLHRSGDRARRDLPSRVATATLMHDQVCAICDRNPCQGHSRLDLVSGLAAAGLLFASPALRRGDPGLQGATERLHLRPVA